MMRVKRTQTTFKVHGLNLAVYLAQNFHFLQEQAIDIKPKLTVQRVIQEYLDQHVNRIGENKLRAIFGIYDVYPNATGGRVHLLVGLEGPIIEAIQPSVIDQPIDYEPLHYYLLKAVQGASQEKPPRVGNIHFHPFHCNVPNVTPGIMLEFIRKSHGLQNDLQHIADSEIKVFVNDPRNPRWKTVTSRWMRVLLSQKAIEKG